MELPRANLTLYMGQVDEDLVSGPTQRRGDEENIALDVLLDAQLRKLSHLFLFLVLGPGAYWDLCRELVEL
jgi:hypothetical protein